MVAKVFGMIVMGLLNGVKQFEPSSNMERDINYVRCSFKSSHDMQLFFFARI